MPWLVPRPIAPEGDAFLTRFLGELAERLDDPAVDRNDTVRDLLAEALYAAPYAEVRERAPLAAFGLDPRNARVVMDCLRRIHREDGLTVLVNLHHLDTARHYCDRIVALSAGRIVFDGTPAALTPERVRDVYGVSEDEFHDAPAPRAAPVRPPVAVT